MGQPVTAGPLLRFGTDLLTEIIKEMQSAPFSPISTWTGWTNSPRQS